MEKSPENHLITAPGGPLVGQVRVGGDKSISHRALILAACARTESTIKNLSPAQDVQSTIDVLRALGTGITQTGSTVVVTPTPWTAPSQPLNCGNSGTTARMMMGVLGARGIAAQLVGDASLSARSMTKVSAALATFGVTVGLTDGRLPATIKPSVPHAATLEMDDSSAQIKSACLLAALHAEGGSEIIEHDPARDHTERMLAQFGGAVRQRIHGKSHHIGLDGPQTLDGTHIDAPGDISSVAFLAVVATLCPGSEIAVTDVGLNPCRTEFIDVMRQMGADIQVQETDMWGDEPVGTITIRHARALRGVAIPAHLTPYLIDEYPALSVLAACADGVTMFTNAAALRNKECDRLMATAQNLRQLGVTVDEKPDGLAIHGGSDLRADQVINGFHDHRIIMAFASLGIGSGIKTRISDANMIAISDPGFVHRMQGVGANLNMEKMVPA